VGKDEYKVVIYNAPDIGTSDIAMMFLSINFFASDPPSRGKV
jgi:hypothetical protein